MLDIGGLRDLCHDSSIVLTKHAATRMRERGITIENIKNAVRIGEIIQQYKEDKPFPSCLMLGETEQNKKIHIVASVNGGYMYVITAYYPNEKDWGVDMKHRKEGSR
ncbi:MAG: DUF4258 domain-containing protein [Oscillospiraceae bacterium]|nr:DUF4258 domain-containing protein [Oscillospiraceae bacterium]